MIDWSDPAARAHLAERISVTANNAAFTAHRATSVVETINGHAIRPEQTGFGRLFVVGDTGNAYAFMPDAVRYANSIAPGADADSAVAA